jgi:regulator of replication initiation timing
MSLDTFESYELFHELKFRFNEMISEILALKEENKYLREKISAKEKTKKTRKVAEK